MGRRSAGTGVSEPCWISPHRLVGWGKAPRPSTQSDPPRRMLSDLSEKLALVRFHLTRARVAAHRVGEDA